MKPDSFAIKRTKTGLGLFALQPIAKGKRIIEYIGEIITNEEADRRGGKYLFELDEKRSIDGKSRTNIARYINHSCRPNAEGLTTGRRIWIWALKNIKEGEQITIDYGKAYLDSHIKRCQCEKCVATRKKRRLEAKRRREAGG